MQSQCHPCSYTVLHTVAPALAHLYWHHNFTLGQFAHDSAVGVGHGAHVKLITHHLQPQTRFEQSLHAW